MAEQQTPELSVVMGFRDWGLDRLDLALQAHAASPARERFEVVVSDYGSRNRDEVEAVVRSHDATYVYTETDGPWSRSRALNAGLAAASANVLITTDCDLLFTPDLHALVLERVRAEPRSAQLVQCRDLASQLRLEDITLDWDLFEAQSTFRPRWGMGGMIAFPRAALTETGGYDGRMEIYGGEDMDFAQRLRWAGYRIAWIDDPRARIYHVWHPSSRTSADATVEGKEAIERNRAIYVNDTTIVRNVRRPVGGPIATVSIATYNRAEYLRESLYSVLSQPVADIEVLVVDDGSTDDTADVVRAIGDSRVRYIRQDNGGVASARNRAVAEARAPYIVIHDDDDIMLPWRIEAHFEAFRVGAHGTFGGWVDFTTDGTLLPRPGKQFSHAAVLYTNAVVTHASIMIRKDVLERFPYNEMLRAGTDYNLVLRMATAGVVLNHTGEYHILRRLHDTNLTFTISEHQKESARRTANLLRRRLNRTDEDKARKAARALEAVPCRGDDDIAARVRAYLPDALVRRVITVDAVDTLDEVRARLAEEGMTAELRYGVGRDDTLVHSALVAEGATWSVLHRLRTLDPTLEITAEPIDDAPEAAPADHATATAGWALRKSRRQGDAEKLIARLLDDDGVSDRFVGLVFSEAGTSAADDLWRSQPDFRKLVTAGGVQYVAARTKHPSFDEALDGAVAISEEAGGAPYVVVDLSDDGVREAINEQRVRWTSR